MHKGRWHGEVAIRLLEIDGNNQDHLKLFKKEVMNYRQTRHENVVLFMGACMAPPHLAIITRWAQKYQTHLENDLNPNTCFHLELNPFFSLPTVSVKGGHCIQLSETLKTLWILIRQDKLLRRL